MTIFVPIPQPIKKIAIFEGGGVKGIAYDGVIKDLKKNGDLKNLTYVCGSSAGAIAALMVSLDYTSDEINTELSRNFSEFKYHEPRYFGSFGRVIHGLINFFTKKHGYYSTKKLQEWVEGLIEKKLKNKNATFEDLHNKIKENSNFKALYVTATYAEGKETKFFSFEDTPEIYIAEAIVASAAIPFFFERKVINGKQYYDGGVLDNFPIEHFNNKKYWPDGYSLFAKEGDITQAL